MLQQDKQSLSRRAAGLRIYSEQPPPFLVLFGEYKVILYNNMCETEPGDGDNQRWDKDAVSPFRFQDG